MLICLSIQSMYLSGQAKLSRLLHMYLLHIHIFVTNRIWLTSVYEPSYWVFCLDWLFVLPLPADCGWWDSVGVALQLGVGPGLDLHVRRRPLDVDVGRHSHVKHSRLPNHRVRVDLTHVDATVLDPIS